ncbi:MAG: hypothetical protein CTY20_02320 [Hyphomicrobium sp.]|nr:MAG: hypothetical protein CTY20_02320 [Hyphomicrobium sp.]
MTLVLAGVDGCRGGWIAVLRAQESPATALAVFCPAFRDILDLAPAPGIIAVDMPIGLPERGGIGGRQADIEARAILGHRRSAVFAVPARAAVMETGYRAACDASLRASDPPRKVSKQTFNIFPKIRELDTIMTPALQERVVECHPEVAFWALNSATPLHLPKKVKSRAHPPGLALRRSLLESAGYPAALFEHHPWPLSVAGPDDLLDAAVNSWSAARIARGEARRFPADPPRDGRGLRMEICA